MSDEDNWGDYGDDDIRWTRPVETSGWGSRASALPCGCTPDRECPRCNGEDEDSAAKWAWDKALPVITARRGELARPLTVVEIDRVWLSFVPRRFRKAWADELAEKRAAEAAEREATA